MGLGAGKIFVCIFMFMFSLSKAMMPCSNEGFWGPVLNLDINGFFCSESVARHLVMGGAMGIELSLFPCQACKGDRCDDGAFGLYGDKPV
jgi:hypothetical protein